MDALLLLIVCGGGFLLAYHTYGRFLARKIFNLTTGRKVPSNELADGIDYVSTRRGIIFGHHYTSIAGTGPIVGPAIGIIWGWLPALLWVVFGSIFLGAVHDFGSLVVSMRNEGKSLSEVAAKYINIRVRFIFFAIVFLTLLLVIAVFGVVIASVFTLFPSSVLAVWLQIPIAVALGWAVYKKNINVTGATIIAASAMYASIALGALLENIWPGLLLPREIAGIPPTGLWVIILLIYAWIASTLSVTTLLQPRDYINAWQLFIAMGLLVVGTITAAFTADLSFAAPAVNTAVPTDTPSLWPFMFVIIACGAISGFHSLVASGTSPKQIASEPDSLFVGYGSMLLEGFLAILVIIAIGAGVGMALEVDGTTLFGQSAWLSQYDSWIGARGLGDRLSPFIIGAANITETIGLPKAMGIAIMGVFIASFAGTTLDTAVRLQRYVVSELAADIKMPSLANRWTATTIAAGTAAALAFMQGADGTGAMILWPLFGTANQLLAALALLVVTIYLRTKPGCKYLVTAVPCLIMLVITNWAMVENQLNFIRERNWPLVIIGSGVFLLALWMTVETAILFFTKSQQKPKNITPGAQSELTETAQIQAPD